MNNKIYIYFILKLILKMLSIKNVKLNNKKVLIRSDFNVPIKDNKILCDIKIKLSLNTIKYALKSGAYVIVCSHLGNPNINNIKNFSLNIIKNYIFQKFNIKINLIKNYINGININNIKKNEIILLENVRFNKGEIDNDDNLSIKYANLCDIFIMDAFASSHRKHSSTYGIVKFVKQTCFGFLFIKEYKNLLKIFSNLKKPIISIIGGSKISNKIKTLKFLLEISDKVYVGGGIANNLLYINNKNIGKSLIEINLNKNNFNYLLKYNNIFIPKDFKISKNYIYNVKSYKYKLLNEIKNNDYILDIGKNYIKSIIKDIKLSNTIIWIGAIGMFEIDYFSLGTKLILNAIYKNKNLFSIFGGGDTLFSLCKFNFLNKVSYFSTGGGAFLKFIKIKKISILEKIYTKN